MYRWIEAKGLPAHRIGKLWKLKLGTMQQWHQVAPNPWVIVGMLRAVIMGLSPASPETDRFSAAWWRRRGAQQEARSVWYRHQKQHWLGWLGEYDGPPMGVDGAPLSDCPDREWERSRSL